MFAQNLVDGVNRYPETGIKTIVIGAGVGGLLAALEAWRKGSDVVVLERASELSPTGDYFTIPPSGLATLSKYPSMHAEYHKQVYDCTISIWHPSGELVKKTKPEWTRPGAENLRIINNAAPDVSISFITRRPVFTQMLLDQCVRLGIPVHFGHKVVKMTEDDGKVEVEGPSGEKLVADVCIQACGIGSNLSSTWEGKPRVLDSGYTAARMAWPTWSIKKGSPAEQLLRNVESEPEFRTYLGNDLHLILFLTKDHVAFAYTHQSDGNAAESWNNLRDMKEIIEDLKTKSDNWDPAVIDLLEQAPGQVIDWGLRWRDPDEKWTSPQGRIIKVGDTAHAFLPTAGNGAVQACEDAISLGECLRLGGKNGVTWATGVHNRLRFERVSVLQQAGFVNRDELHHADLDAIAREPGVDVGFFKSGKWVWSHNPERYATENFSLCLSHLRDGKPFVNTNLPPGHVFRPWTMESEDARMAASKQSDLKSNGYWGV